MLMKPLEIAQRRDAMLGPGRFAQRKRGEYRQIPLQLVCSELLDWTIGAPEPKMEALYSDRVLGTECRVLQGKWRQRWASRASCHRIHRCPYLLPRRAMTR